MVVFHQRPNFASGGTSLRHQMQDNLPQILRQDRKPAGRNKKKHSSFAFLASCWISAHTTSFTHAILVGMMADCCGVMGLYYNPE